MVTSAVNQAPSSNNNESPFVTELGKDFVNQEDFLKLLIAQLKNQDPLNPMENQEFVSELATFSSLEQQTNQTKLLEQLVNNQQSTTTSQALSLIGKDVTMAESQFRFNASDPVEFSFIADHAGPTQIQVTDDADRVVFADGLNVPAPGRYTYVFDGVNEEGKSVPPGAYNMQIGPSLDGDGLEGDYPVSLRGSVEGVRFENNSPVLMVNGTPTPISQIESVYERKEVNP